MDENHGICKVDVSDKEFNNNNSNDSKGDGRARAGIVSDSNNILPHKRMPNTCLRFGIDTILSAGNDDKMWRENDVKDTNREDTNACINTVLINKVGEDYGNYYKRDFSKYVNEKDNISETPEDSTDTCNDVAVDFDDVTREDDHDDTDRDVSVIESRVPYIHFPLAYTALRSSSVTLTSQQSVFPMLNPGSSWSTALVADYRKERFTSVRRVGHPYQNRTPPKRKKPRTSFSRVQIVELEKRFERQKYLASTERSALAKSLKMSDAQVKTWFQNRRTKWRRQTAEERELERQAANRLLLSLQTDSANRKSAMILSPDRMCLSQMKMFQERRMSDT